MDDYEIRIITVKGRTSHHFASALPSDFAAIRRAHALVRPGQGIEVWRGAECIYANHRDHPLLLPPRRAETEKPDYEIRILRGDLKPSIIWKSSHDSDRAAIRAGVLAAGGQGLEIWRDLDCIFRAPAAERPLP